MLGVITTRSSRRLPYRLKLLKSTLYSTYTYKNLYFYLFPPIRFFVIPVRPARVVLVLQAAPKRRARTVKR